MPRLRRSRMNLKSEPIQTVLFGYLSALETDRLLPLEVNFLVLNN